MKLTFQDENLQSTFSSYLIMVIIVTIIMFFFDVTIAIGWLLGNVLFYISFNIKMNYFEMILSRQVFNVGAFILIYLLSLLIMTFAVGIGFMRPDIVSPIASSAGFLGFKFFIYFKNIMGGKSV